MGQSSAAYVTLMLIKFFRGGLVRVFLVLCVLGVVLWPSEAQAQGDFTGKTVSSIVFKYRGPKTVDEARLRNFMSIKVGSKYDPELLDNDIKRLYETGLVDDVRFLAEPVGDKLKLIAEVVTRPLLGEIGRAHV